MATSVLSNTILDPSGAALSGVVVKASLRGIVGGFRSSTFTEISTSKTTTTDSAGLWSLTLERQADILPAGSYWEVEEQIPVVSGGVRVWAVTMGSVNANLYASLLTSLPSGGAGIQYLTEAAGDARYVPIAGNSTVQITAPSFSSAGLTGAVAGARFVGATAGGKPTTGTFAVGDYIIDRAGYLWICTVAGSPGTWVSLAAGALPGGYTQVVTVQNSITTETDLTGLTVTVTVGTGRRIRISGQAKVMSTVAQDRVVVRIKEGANEYSNVVDVVVPFNNATCLGSGSIVLTPSSGSHTYKLTGHRVGGTGAVSLEAYTTVPAFILVEDIGGV